MSLKLKAIVASVAMFASFGANAISTSNGGEFFLVAYDSASKNSFISSISSAVLGGATATSFTSGTNSTGFTFAGNADWTSFTGAGTAAGTTVYSVFGIDTTSKTLWTTTSGGAISAASQNIGNTNQFSNVMQSFISGSGKTFMDGFTSLNGLSGTTTTAVVLNNEQGDTSGNMFGNKWFNNFASTDINSQATIGISDRFYRLTMANANDPSAELLSEGPVGAFRLLANGGLTYSSLMTVAAVPEMETSAMMIAGLGLIGLIARRRRAI